MTTFVDSNVVVYAHDRSDTHKQARAAELLLELAAAGTLVLSTQVLQESYVNLLRKGLLAPADALSAIEALALNRVVVPNGDFVLRGFRLGQAERLSPWDALIVQAALDAGCTRLLSEDMNAGQRFGPLQIVNPFATAAHEPPAPMPARARPRRRPSGDA